MKVRTEYVPEDSEWYLTPGKIYNARRAGNATFTLTDDVNDLIVCSESECAHLDGRDWEIVTDV